MTGSFSRLKIKSFKIISSCFGTSVASKSHTKRRYRVMDHDTYSANDPIGRVYIDINNLIDLAYCNAANGEAIVAISTLTPTITAEPSGTRVETVSRKRQSTASRDSTSSLSNSDDQSLASSEGAITLNTQTNVATTSTMHTAETRGKMPIVDTLLGLLFTLSLNEANVFLQDNVEC